MAFDIPVGKMTVYMEASGAGPAGIQAVAYVLTNRWRSGKFGGTLAAVCLKPLQFSCWNTSDSNRLRMALATDDDPILLACGQALADAINHTVPDPTDGAMYYFDDSIPTPHWADAMNLTCKIGHLSFYR